MENGFTDLGKPGSQSDVADSARRRDDSGSAQSGDVIITPTLPKIPKPSEPPRAQAATNEPKRKKTKGEVAFDVAVYAGGAWVLNEIISAWVGNKVRGVKNVMHGEVFPPNVKAEAVPKGVWHDGYVGLVNWFNDTFNFVKNSKTLNKPIEQGGLPLGERSTAWFKRGAEVFMLCTGGNLLLVPIKMLEDKKSQIVRWFDRKFYGSKSETDPDLKKAHADMDKTQRQSWGSVLKARVAALAVAIGGDAAFADTNAYSTYLFKDAKAAKAGAAFVEGHAASYFSSLTRIGVTLTRKILPILRPSMKNTIETAWKVSPYAVTVSEGRAASIGVLMVYLTTLSGAVAGSFYGFTRLFAATRDKKNPEQKEALAARLVGVSFNAPAPARIDRKEVQNDKPIEDKPRLTISHVSREAQMVSSAPGVQV